MILRLGSFFIAFTTGVVLAQISTGAYGEDHRAALLVLAFITLPQVVGIIASGVIPSSKLALKRLTGILTPPITVLIYVWCLNALSAPPQTVSGRGECGTMAFIALMALVIVVGFHLIVAAAIQFLVCVAHKAAVRWEYRSGK